MRGIKPDTWTDESFVECSPLARLLFIGMWNYACDNGHLDDRPRQIKMRVLPADDCDADELLKELEHSGLIDRRDGYVKVTGLTRHQKIDRRFLTLCSHCAHDEECRYRDKDRKDRTA